MKLSERAFAFTYYVLESETITHLIQVSTHIRSKTISGEVRVPFLGGLSYILQMYFVCMSV